MFHERVTFRILRVAEHAVVVVDGAVAVLVNIAALDGEAVGVVDLLVEMEGIGGIAYLVGLDIVACTARDAAGGDE